MSAKNTAQPRTSTATQSQVAPTQSAVQILSLMDIDRKTAELNKQLAELNKQRKIHEFLADPDGYDKRLLRGAVPDVERKDHPLKKPAGTHRSLPNLILDVFDDYPEVEFSAGTMVSKLNDRGWVTRCRGKLGLVATNLSKLCIDKSIVRVDRGIYKKA